MGIAGSTLVWQLPHAFRSLPRPPLLTTPRHPPRALGGLTTPTHTANGTRLDHGSLRDEANRPDAVQPTLVMVSPHRWTARLATLQSISYEQRFVWLGSASQRSRTSASWRFLCHYHCVGCLEIMLGSSATDALVQPEPDPPPPRIRQRDGLAPDSPPAPRKRKRLAPGPTRRVADGRIVREPSRETPGSGPDPPKTPLHPLSPGSRQQCLRAGAGAGRHDAQRRSLPTTARTRREELTLKSEKKLPPTANGQTNEESSENADGSVDRSPTTKRVVREAFSSIQSRSDSTAGPSWGDGVNRASAAGLRASGEAPKLADGPMSPLPVGPGGPGGRAG